MGSERKAFDADGARRMALQVLEAEERAVGRMRAAVDDAFVDAVRLILNASGLCVSGIGKAGLIGRKLAATFASTGTPAHFLSAADALHGDVGAVRRGDAVLLLSASGESDEIVRLLDILRKLNHPVVAITASRASTLGRHATHALLTGPIDEACPLKLAPSASTTAMLALGDALALSVMSAREFTADDFAVFHPAGQIGRRLMKVSEAMTFRLGENLPIASDRLDVGGVLGVASRVKRRSGAVILVDDNGRLSGLFSDGDLRRLVERDPANSMRTPIASVMTRDPKRIRADALASEALAVMRPLRIDELPVVDDAGRPVGLIDVQDLVVLKMFDIDANA